MLSYEEQIERLIKIHNLIIKDKETAINILNKVNYYRLSGYGIGLTQENDREKYQEGISLEHLHKTKKTYLQSWILALVEIRNICAHYGVGYADIHKHEGYPLPASCLDLWNMNS